MMKELGRQVQTAAIASLLWVGSMSLLLGAEPGRLTPRVALEGLRVVGSPEPPLPYLAEPRFQNLKIGRPVSLLLDPDQYRNRSRAVPGQAFGFSRRFVLGEREGRIRWFSACGEGPGLSPFLTVTGTELLAMAFHPQYQKNRLVYVLLVRPVSPEGGRPLQLLQYRVRTEGTYSVEPESELLLLESIVHGNFGGGLAFGPDGKLYVGLGDGSSGGDLFRSGQDLSDLNASILRIDVDQPDQGRPYSIPADNPFVNRPGARGEVWALGLRHPWRLHFDPEGRLWVADVGESNRESILLVEKGDNFGWSRFEGGAPHHGDVILGPGRLKKPAIVHDHTEAQAILGGVFYQGDGLPGLRGSYIYGDHVTGMIWAAQVQPDGTVQTTRICDTGRNPSSFALGDDGEVLFLDFGRGAICTLVPRPPEPPPAVPFPLSLSDTGLFENVPRHEPRPGVIPYEITASLWSDGTVKRRWLAIPGLGRVRYSATQPWKFPEGTVFLKSFGQPLGDPTDRVRWIETRLLVFQQGRWAGYSYRWNDEGTDANLVAESGDQASFIEEQPGRGEVRRVWKFPGRLQCFTCHSQAAHHILGFELAQLNRDCPDSPPGEQTLVPKNQLERFDQLGLFESSAAGQPEGARPIAPSKQKPAPSTAKTRSFPGASRKKFDDQKSATVPGDHLAGKDSGTPTKPSQPSVAETEGPTAVPPVLVDGAGHLPRMVDPADGSAPLELRARSYLHANCGHCHRHSGAGNASLRLNFAHPVANMHAIDRLPEHGPVDRPPQTKLITPGDPDNSLLLRRMELRGPPQMPPLGSQLPDTVGIQLIRQWIAEMPVATP